MRNCAVCNRQLDRDFEACGREIRSVYLSPVQTNRFSGDGEAEAVPTGRFRVAADSVEGLKDRFQRIFRHARAMIADEKKRHRFQRVPIYFQNNLDPGSRLCEADRVANDVLAGASERMGRHSRE